MRNREWLESKHRDATLKFFEENRLTFVCVDVPPGFPNSLPPLTTATTDLAMVRFHGRNGDAWERGADTGDDRMAYDYRRGDLEPWEPRLVKLRVGGARGARPVHDRPRGVGDARRAVARARAHRGTPSRAASSSEEATAPTALSEGGEYAPAAFGDRNPQGDARMSMPTDIGIIDTMIGFPHENMKAVYAFITRQTKDRESKEDFEFPVEYMFKQVPEKQLPRRRRPGIGDAARDGPVGHREGPDRRGRRPRHRRAGAQAAPRPVHPVDAARIPTRAWTAVRKIVRDYETYGVRAVGMFPAGTFPQVAINDKKMYPIYAKCVELDIPVFCCAGVPGPRLRFEPQHVELIDEVMYDFPELTFVHPARLRAVGRTSR